MIYLFTEEFELNLAYSENNDDVVDGDAFKYPSPWN
jgi:hypothetical protein